MWHQLNIFISFRDRVLRVPNLAGSTQFVELRVFKVIWCRKHSGAYGGRSPHGRLTPLHSPFLLKGAGSVSCRRCRFARFVVGAVRWSKTETVRPHCGSQNYHSPRKTLFAGAAWTVRKPTRYRHGADAELRGAGIHRPSRAQRRGGAG